MGRGWGDGEDRGDGVILDFGFWILDFGFWILDFGLFPLLRTGYALRFSVFVFRPSDT